MFRKPPRWALTRGLVDLNHQRFWEGGGITVPMWEGSGNVRDYSSGLTGVLTGNISWATTKYGRVTRFTDIAGSERFRFANHPEFDFTDPPFTAVVWVIPAFAQTVSSSSVAFDNTVGNNDGYRLIFAASIDDWRFRLGTSTALNVDTVGAIFSSGDLLQLVCRYDGVTATIDYANITTGESQTQTGSGTGKLDTPTGDPLFIGAANAGGGGMLGDILYLAIRHRHWSDGEVLANRLDPFGPFGMIDEVGSVIVPAVAAAGVEIFRRRIEEHA